MRTSLFNSLLMHWSFENKEIIEQGVSEISTTSLKSLLKDKKKCEKDATCLRVEYPFFLDIYFENEIERIEINN